MSKENPFDEIISWILKSREKESVKTFWEVIEIFWKLWYSFPSKESFDIDSFYILNQYKFDNLIDWYMMTNLTSWKMNDNVSFLLKNSHFVNTHFEKLIVDFEWSTCCADKSRNILRKLYNYFLNDEKIIFNSWSYSNTKKIFKNEEEILEFYNSLRNLYYWHSLEYINIIDKLTNRYINILDILKFTKSEAEDAYDYYKNKDGEDKNSAFYTDPEIFKNRINDIEKYLSEWELKLEPFIIQEILQSVQWYRFKNIKELEAYLVSNKNKIIKSFELEKAINKFKN